MHCAALAMVSPEIGGQAVHVGRYETARAAQGTIRADHDRRAAPSDCAPIVTLIDCRHMDNYTIIEYRSDSNKPICPPSLALPLRPFLDGPVLDLTYWTDADGVTHARIGGTGEVPTGAISPRRTSFTPTVIFEMLLKLARRDPPSAAEKAGQAQADLTTLGRDITSLHFDHPVAAAWRAVQEAESKLAAARIAHEADPAVRALAADALDERMRKRPLPDKIGVLYDEEHTDGVGGIHVDDDGVSYWVPLITESAPGEKPGKTLFAASAGALRRMGYDVPPFTGTPCPQCYPAKEGSDNAA